MKKLFELYNKFINGSLNIHGILLTPIAMDDNTITFEMDNPEDISYSEECLKGYLMENTDKFKTVLGLPRLNLNPKISNADTLYINWDLKNKIEDYLNSVNVLTLKHNDTINKIYIEHSDFDIVIQDETKVKISNYVNPIKSTIDYGTGEKPTILMKAIEMYEYNQSQHRYDETDESYLGIDSILNEEEALVDPDWMVQYVVTYFD
jgi:hypothetical protein